MDSFILLTLVGIFGALYFYITRTFNYWKDRNVRGPKPAPLFGNIFKFSTQTIYIGEILQNAYKDYPKEKVVGVFRMTTPNLLVRDLDIVQHVLIKDFDNFIDRGIEFSKDGLGKNLFHSDGDTWRALRSRFSPMFTNQKLKHMMHLITDKADILVDYVQEIIAKNPDQPIHHLVQKYTIASIAACAFGLDIDTFREEHETINRVDRDIFTLNYGVELDMMFPGVLKTLNMSIFPQSVTTFFRDIIKQVITDRKGQPTNRRDFMDLILEMRNKQEIQAAKRFESDKESILEITDSIMEGQAFVFYAGGYETSASTMGFLLYQLALNTDIQDKLRAEIDNYLLKNNNEITLETLLKDLPYLEQCFDETLRMYPIVDILQRKAMNEYRVPGTDLMLEKNHVLLVSVLGIHHDEKYYPNPSKFDPERFSPELVAARHPCAYVPFGAGPRHCIGMRFAQVQSRVCIVRLLSRFRLEPSRNTARSFKFHPRRLVLGPNEPLYVNVLPRKDK